MQPTYVFIASGIGITPFRSIIKNLIDTKKNESIFLLYQSKRNEFLFEDIFEQAQERGVVTRYIKDDTHLDQAVIKHHITNPLTPIYYLSGPQHIIETQRQLLMDMGVDQTRIKTDLFSGYEKV